MSSTIKSRLKLSDFDCPKCGIPMKKGFLFGRQIAMLFWAKEAVDLRQIDQKADDENMNLRIAENLWPLFHGHREAAYLEAVCCQSCQLFLFSNNIGAQSLPFLGIVHIARGLPLKGVKSLIKISGNKCMHCGKKDKPKVTHVVVLKEQCSSDSVNPHDYLYLCEKCADKHIGV